VGIDHRDLIYLFNAIVKAGNAWKFNKLNISNIDMRAKASKFLANCISSHFTNIQDINLSKNSNLDPDSLQYLLTSLTLGN